MKIGGERRKEKERAEGNGRREGMESLEKERKEGLGVKGVNRSEIKMEGINKWK